MTTRKITELKYGWKFSRQRVEGFQCADFADGDWETVRVPHDWAIYGPFDVENDQQIDRIVEDGEPKDSVHTGRTGALPHVGDGIYRKRVFVPEEAEGKRFRLEFDGVMSHSEVFVNEGNIGGWPFGYASFALDVTNRIVCGAENLICVAAHNYPHSSRWYPGAGIYRNVRLVELNCIHIDYNGVYVKTAMTSENSADIMVELKLRYFAETPEGPVVENILLDDGGNVVAADVSVLEKGGKIHVSNFKAAGLKRWDLESPNLYTIRSIVKNGDEILDQVETSIGFREILFDKDKGFFLNGKHVKIKGVCMHHDMGALGTAVNVRALERQIEILKSFGTNAIRTSHNPPTPELLDLCDRMGILVMDECLDEWEVPKVKNGYSHLWSEWAEKDMTALIERDRNHPCVIIWSIGNEVRDQVKFEGKEYAKFLYDICKKLDPDRPVTCGYNASDHAIANGLAEAVDIQGWNYKPYMYEKYRAENPGFCMIGSETSSTVSSRGVYHFPVRVDTSPASADLQLTAYELCVPPWANLVETEFVMQRKCDYILGEFVWTGFDYLGEPSPFKTQWPSRSSYFGIVDLCGFPKDRYYLYKSEWCDDPMLHVFPHWDWPGREGENTPIMCVTTYDSAELFVNGRSFGVRRKGEFAASNIDFSCEKGRTLIDHPVLELRDCISDFRLIWDDVPYEPGSIKVVAYDDNGKPAMQQILETTTGPASIELIADRSAINADGDDLSFVTVRVIDAQGRFVPNADNLIEFKVEGQGELIAVDNGDATSLESFQGDKMKAFSGMCLAVIRSMLDEQGEIILSATSAGLEEAKIIIRAN